MKVFRYSELCDKEVICVCDGKRLGYIDDFEADAENGCILVFLIPDAKGSLFKKRTVWRVDRRWIERICEDLVLVRRYERSGEGAGQGQDGCC